MDHIRRAGAVGLLKIKIEVVNSLSELALNLAGCYVENSLHGFVVAENLGSEPGDAVSLGDGHQ